MYLVQLPDKKQLRGYYTKKTFTKGKAQRLIYRNQGGIVLKNDEFVEAVMPDNKLVFGQWPHQDKDFISMDEKFTKLALVSTQFTRPDDYCRLRALVPYLLSTTRWINECFVGVFFEGYRIVVKIDAMFKKYFEEPILKNVNFESVPEDLPLNYYDYLNSYDKLNNGQKAKMAESVYFQHFSGGGTFYLYDAK